METNSDVKPPLSPPFEIHAPKTIGHLLGLVPIYLASTILLTKSVLKISRGKQNMVKAPPSLPFEIHAPKTIGHLLGLVPIYPASTILLTTAVLKISRGNQLGRTES